MAAGGMRGAWLDSFEFKEFEEFLENCLDTLQPFGWRRIAFPLRGTPPPAPELSACSLVTGSRISQPRLFRSIGNVVFGQ